MSRVRAAPGGTYPHHAPNSRPLQGGLVHRGHAHADMTVVRGIEGVDHADLAVGARTVDRPAWLRAIDGERVATGGGNPALVHELRRGIEQLALPLRTGR